MDTFIQNYNDLARRIFVNEFEMRGKNNNIIFSPFSDIMLMAVLLDATGGNTRQEIIRALGDDGSGDMMAAGLKKMLDRFCKDGKLLSADYVFIKSELKESVNPDFEERLRENFAGRLFATQELFADVNKWINEKTKGMINNVISGEEEGLLFGMGNATSFESEWEQEYKEDDILNRDFTNADGSIVRVKMLVSQEKFYVQNGEWEGFVKPYKHGKFSFMALLPKVEKYELTGEEIARIDFTALYKGKEDVTLDIQMPEFKASSAGKMKDILQKLGIKELFTDHADFSSFSSEQLRGEEIFHKAFIKVDRNGTKAAAVAYMFGAGADIILYKNICLDRPFVYAIIDCETGLPVFIGVINYLDAADENEITWEDKKINCSAIFNRIFEKLEDIDEDRLYEEGTREHQLYSRARKACYQVDIQELGEIETEVDLLMGVTNNDG